MPTAYVVAPVVATVVNVAVYVWPLQAALPGLGYGPGFVVRQTSFAISNAVPAGGAVGLGVQYGMLDSYGFCGAGRQRHRDRERLQCLRDPDHAGRRGHGPVGQRRGRPTC